MKYGTIIFLNGLTSTGKTSIINEMTARKDKRFYVLGFDLFEETIPFWLADQSEYYSKAIIAMYAAARSFSEQGQDIIIDGLIMNITGLMQHYQTLRQIFKGYPLKIIDVHCSLEILRQRNLMRGDRKEYQSLEQSKIAETNITYELSIDTGVTQIKECADLVLGILNGNQDKEQTVAEVREQFLSEDVYHVYSDCMYQPTYEKFNRRVQAYLQNPSVSLYVSKDDLSITGAIVIETDEDGVATIQGISVAKECRKRGIGRYLIAEVMRCKKIHTLIAETDDDAIEFYRNCGFETKEFYQTYKKGVFKRYHCVLHNTSLYIEH